MPDPDLDGLADHLDRMGFSGVVAVARGGKTLLELARGHASTRWRVPNMADTRFDTASITKLFTSVAVLQLVAAGKLDLDGSIHDYADLDGTTISPAVTLRQLLTHTSGIADDADEEAGEDYAALFLEKPCYTILQTADFLPQFAYKPARAAPGATCRYCNVGYVLAGLAVERVSGESYRDYVTRAVFGAAGMNRSGFFDRRDAVPDVAEGWDRDGKGGWRANIFSYPPIGSPDGGAQVTAADALRFLQALRDGALLPPGLTEAFFTPQVRHASGVWFGFGLEFSATGYGKDGINAGVSGKLFFDRKTGLDSVVLSNSVDGAWPVVAELERRFAAA